MEFIVAFDDSDCCWERIEGIRSIMLLEPEGDFPEELSCECGVKIYEEYDHSYSPPILPIPQL
jgi:hypothetical protein